MAEEAIKELFAAYGEIVECTLIKDKFTGRSRGFAFVELADEAMAAKAIEELNGKEIEGRAIVVNESRPMEKREGGFRPRTGGSGGYRNDRN